MFTVLFEARSCYYFVVLIAVSVMDPSQKVPRPQGPGAPLLRISELSAPVFKPSPAEL